MNIQFRHLLMTAVTFVFMVFLSYSASAYEETKVSNGGSVKGKVTYSGTVPMRTVVPTKNKDICGGVRKDPLIIVGKDKGVKDAVVFIKGITKGKAWKRPSKTPELDNKKCRFVPHVQVVPIGEKIAIVNSDPHLHNTHSFLDGKTVFNVALPFQGARVERPLKKAGIVRVECDVHGWMRGWIYVADNPYYSITSEKGSFDMSDVPPGDYTLVVWQEHTGMIEKQVSVTGGKTVTINIELK
jgi:plastocyanin